MAKVLVLYFSKSDSVKELARLIARGIHHETGVEALLRCAPDPSLNHINAATRSDQDPYVTLEELSSADALALGGPAYFGGICSPLKHFLDQTSALWLSGSLVDKPACVFTASATMHGGNEACLLDMMKPLIHHGMVIVGIPYTEPTLNTSQTGGSPYGASRVTGTSQEITIHTDERKLAIALGKRLARITLKLQS